MKTRRIYNHENSKKDHAFNVLIRNTLRLSAAELLEESDKLWREKVKREKMTRERKRKLRQQREAEEAAKIEMSVADCETS